MTASLRELVEKTSSGPYASLTNQDMVQLFFPYVEMNNRFNRVLPSQSYLAYFLENFEALFQNTKDCTFKSNLENKQVNSEIEETGTTKKAKGFLNKLKKLKL